MNPNLFEMDKLVLFLLMFVPGFISLKVYDSIFPNPPRDFTKYWIDAIGYSAVNYAVMGCLLSLMGFIEISSLSIYISYNWFIVVLFFWLLIFPVCYPLIYLILIKSEWFPPIFIHPIQKPWDYLFWQGQSYWVIVYLKNGNKVGGKYSKDSFASSYPDGAEIMLEEVWDISWRGEFLQPANPKRGVVLCSSDVLKIEFLEDAEDEEE